MSRLKDRWKMYLAAHAFHQGHFENSKKRKSLFFKNSLNHSASLQLLRRGAVGFFFPPKTLDSLSPWNRSISHKNVSYQPWPFRAILVLTLCQCCVTVPTVSPGSFLPLSFLFFMLSPPNLNSLPTFPLNKYPQFFNTLSSNFFLSWFSQCLSAIGL